MSHRRTNKSTTADIITSPIFASGTFKNVWAGHYTSGDRKGQPCVSKEFKSGSVYEKHYFSEELEIIRRTQEIVNDFHTAGIIPGREVIVNTPAIWRYEDSAGGKAGHRSLVEPMIENFEKFNSNTGWTGQDNVWNEAMQALSHFSYHDSGRRFLLCDLQGGLYSDGYILSDPVIMSQAHNCGPADLGNDGIKSFFERHRCGQFCDQNWVKPALTGRAPIPMRRGTTMECPPTRHDRNPLSRLREN
ncbi:putative elongation factor 2 protein [Botrytis fragariae]|uniref:Putative elongation factor 2 protein n=1 Tax=Botrytis fragariae TaxID=1964551 RepID=A0A8H6EG56_9HELO|nr:putative elongation factor 2 protein [Botrytis fragariae]KAF5870948.1 putative elongation factor 2 protein [Botrytis fragariae]